MEGLFIMTMLVDLSDLSITLDELVMGLRKIGEEINMETTLRLAGGPLERKRVAVLVTKEPHCLVQLVQDRDAGVLNGDLLVVLANHPDLEPRASTASPSRGRRRPTRRRTRNSCSPASASTSPT